MANVLLTYILGIYILRSEGTISLTVPIAGNCGDDTVLTCYVTGSIGFTGWYGLNRSLVLNGVPARPEDNKKYTETQGTTSFTLTIHNTDVTDQGEYRCQNGFDESQAVRLKFECKASSAVIYVTNEKKVTITVDKLYPSSPTFRTSFKNENTDVSISGSRTCASSIQYPGYYRCVWSSSYSIADGFYTYSIVLTTITQADPLTGSFNIVSPLPPAVANMVALIDSRTAVLGNEGQSLTIHCTSAGGYPTPTLVWYKDSVSSSNQLTSKSTGILQSDGTYTVTLQHTFTATLTDDRRTLICRSYYPEADSGYIGSNTSSVILYLRLKPTDPIVVQVSNVIAGGTIEIRCTTSGSRPAANLTWSYHGTTYTGTVNSTFENGTETYTVVSVYRGRVTAADNGQNIQCVVTHPALVSQTEKTASVNINVQFSVQASSTSITGNREMTATGTATLTLICTTGSSNPASDITWKNGSETITNNRPYTETTGKNNGVVRSQQLVLIPTRYMDGDVITCSVSNAVSQSPVTDQATLDLRYSPLIEIRQLDQASEGSNEQLLCKVDSKPISTIIWYHGNTQLLKQTPDNNLLSYNLFPVNRTHYGIYRCKANNGVNPEDEEQVTLSIRFKPVTTTLIGNSIIVANGQNALTLVCTSGSSNPVSDITWRINGIITPSTSNLPDQSGQYDGMVRRRGLTLRPIHDNDGDVVSCEAKNDLGTSESSETTLNLKYRPLIDPMQNQVTVEGNVTVLLCKASSKPASTFRWYRQGQSNVIHEGTGTLDNNQLPYTMSNTRRTHAGIYRCEADNEIEMADTKNMSLIVKYPPDVSVFTKNTTVKHATVLITCNAYGVPNDQYKYGKWIQKWPGTDVIAKEYTGSPSLVLDSLTYEHSGVYSCSASNGIKVFGTNKEYMEGSELLLVKSYPVILNVNKKVSGRLKENATIQIDYYSNVQQSEVKCHKTMNGSRQSEFVIAEIYDDIKVNLQVFSYSIITDGTRAYVTVRMNSKEDFGFYDIVVTNIVDSTFQKIEIVPRGPPSEPYNVTIDGVRHESASLSWIPGYHGGAEQSFVVEVSTDRSKWLEMRTVSGGLSESEVPISAELTGLHESLLYYLRMYAFNEEGNSSYTANVNFTTLTRAHASREYSFIIGGLAGGVSTVVLIAVIVAFLRKRNTCTKRPILVTLRNYVGKNKERNNSKLELNSCDNSRDIYEQLHQGPDRKERNVYDSLEVNSQRSLKNKTVYENLKQAVGASSLHSSLSAASTRTDTNPTYENLKL